MSVQLACDALRQGLCLELRYDGYSRVVEVHAVGRTKDGNDIMRVWQLRGGSVSGERTGWKLLRFDEAAGVVILHREASEAPRPGYARNDRVMVHIYGQL